MNFQIQIINSIKIVRANKFLLNYNLYKLIYKINFSIQQHKVVNF
jgi:hypothetical protein